MPNFSITKNVAVHMPLEACKDCIYCDPSIECTDVAFDEEVDDARSIVCSHEFACEHAYNSARKEEEDGNT